MMILTRMHDAGAGRFVQNEKIIIVEIIIINDHLLYLRCYIGDDWKEKGKPIFL